METIDYEKSLKYPLRKLVYLHTTQGFPCDNCLEKHGQISRYITMFGYADGDKSKEICIFCLSELPLDEQIEILKQSCKPLEQFAKCKYGTHGFTPDIKMFGMQPKTTCNRCKGRITCQKALRDYKIIKRMLKQKEILG